MQLHTNCAQMVTLQNPIPALDWLTVTRKNKKPSKHEIKSVLKFLASNGGRKGGKARWKDMSPEERSEFMRSGPEEMERGEGEAPAVSVLIRIWGHHEALLESTAPFRAVLVT
jgi:hypothetical protein